MFLSVFDVFKIGIGPSSSHTMGPMSAAGRFLSELKDGNWPRARSAKPAAITASLHGSLAFTGIGHGSDRAVILGLAGENPRDIDPDRMDAIIANVKQNGRINPPGHPGYRFRPTVDLILDTKTPLPGHPNGMQFSAFDNDGQLLLRRAYFSIGGGFVVSQDEFTALKSETAPPQDTPWPFANAAEMLDMARRSGLSIAAMKRANEEARLSRQQLDKGLDDLWSVMTSCIDRGLAQDGILPGGLKVRRRARALNSQLAAQRDRSLERQ